MTTYMSGDCPVCLRLGTVLYISGSKRYVCGECASTWSDSFDYEADLSIVNGGSATKVASKDASYLENGLSDDLAQLMGMVRVQTIKEVRGHLNTVREGLQSTYAEGLGDDKSASVVQGNIDALVVACEWLDQWSEKLEEGLREEVKDDD